MTYKQFEAIAKAYRPDVRVSRHGTFCEGRSKWTLGIVFIGKDGKESRVYDYAGTYQEVLEKLGIETVTKEQIKTAEEMLAEFKAEHGKKGLLGNTINNEYFIKQYEDKLRRYERAVKVWEF